MMFFMDAPPSPRPRTPIPTIPLSHSTLNSLSKTFILHFYMHPVSAKVSGRMLRQNMDAADTTHLRDSLTTQAHFLGDQEQCL